MKSVIPIALPVLAAAMVAGSQSALADPTGPGGYLKLDAGAAFMQDVSFSVRGEPGTLKADTGYRVDLTGGYDFNRWVSVELGAGVFRNDIGTVVLGTREAHPDNTWLGGIPLLGNVILRLDNRSRWVPYAGAGAGGVISLLEISRENDMDVSFAYQVFAGVSYELDENAFLTVGYKYLNIFDQSYDIAGTPVRTGHVQQHFLGAGVIWRF